MQAIARRVAVSFASGRVDAHTAGAVTAAFPEAAYFSMAVVAGGTMLIAADTMTKEGCFNVSFLSVDNTVAGAALRANTWQEAECRQCMDLHDAEQAVKRHHCGWLACTPIPADSASRPAGGRVGALGALSLGSASRLDNQQRDALVQLAALMSPYITRYVGGLVDDLTTVFLGPRLAHCLCGCGQAVGGELCKPAAGFGNLDEDGGKQAQQAERSAAQAVVSSEQGDEDAGDESLYMELVGDLGPLSNGRTQPQMEGKPASQADGGTGLFTSSDSVESLTDTSGWDGRSAKRRGSVYRPRTYAQRADSAFTNPTSSDSSPSSSHSPSRHSTDSGGASGADDYHKVVFKGKGAAAAPGAVRDVRQSWLLTFRDPALERAFVAYQVSQRIKLDAIFVLLVCCMVTRFFLNPYHIQHYFASWPVALIVALPWPAMAFNYKWYVAHREAVMMCVNLALSAWVPITLLPRFLAVIPVKRLYSPVWLLRMTAGEQISIASLGYSVRFQSYIPQQLLSLAFAVPHLGQICHVYRAWVPHPYTYPALVVFLTCAALAPALLVRGLEQQQRRIFLSRLHMDRQTSLPVTPTAHAASSSSSRVAA